jgi:TonB family protein
MRRHKSVAEGQANRLRSSLAVSLASHALAAGFIVAAIRSSPVRPITLRPQRPDTTNSTRVFSVDPRPAGGGDSGGNRAKVRDPTHPVSVHRASPPPQPIVATEKPIEAFAPLIPGLIDPRTEAVSRGDTSDAREDDGSGGGRHGGDGPGIRPGSGPGPGSGDDGGDGPGRGATAPRLVHDVKPQYTAAAMNARIQGTVRLECVVRSDGHVGRVRIVRSLDSVFGLDREAIDAARQWEFVPGMYGGRPVDVLVTIELLFTLR